MSKSLKTQRLSVRRCKILKLQRLRVSYLESIEKGRLKIEAAFLIGSYLYFSRSHQETGQFSDVFSRFRMNKLAKFLMITPLTMEPERQSPNDIEKTGRVPLVKPKPIFRTYPSSTSALAIMHSLTPCGRSKDQT